MRFSIAVLFAASLVSALTELKRQDSAPACATTCLQNSPPAPCNATDTPCLCLNQNFLNAVEDCSKKTCTEQELSAAKAAGEAYCKAAGVDLTNPLPACAATCLQQNKPSTSCTDKNDYACLCKDTPFIQSVVSCVRSSCTGQDLTNALLVGPALCRANGVDISSAVGAA